MFNVCDLIQQLVMGYSRSADSITLGRVLGEGASAVVYEATDLQGKNGGQSNSLKQYQTGRCGSHASRDRSSKTSKPSEDSKNY